MGKFSCSTIGDILPLYVDDVISQDTRLLVDEHLKCCSACRRKLDHMRTGLTLPVENNVKPLKAFKTAWKREKIRIALIAVLITLCILSAGYLVYENVDVVHRFFSPSTVVTMRDTPSGSQWKRLDVGEDGYLLFDSIFYDKQMVLDGNCQGPVTFRFYDRQGNLVVDSITLHPGTGASLEMLEQGVPYLVEVQTAEEHIVVRFF